MSEWNKKREVMRRYDHSALVYDIQYGEEQEAKIKAALNCFKLEKNSLVLDVGCGTGLLFPYITRNTNLLVGLDFSRSILKQAKKRCREHPSVALLRADADFLPFRNQTFNAVFAITLLQNMPNPLQALNEIKRVAKSQAVVIATGLRKEFSKDEFMRLLKKARLRILVMKADKQLRGYVVVCSGSFPREKL
jgi:demethylmenaquinone methyltransferase/2-methoxy-6-polyprenyl-1,4-benzoquinol methylase